ALDPDVACAGSTCLVVWTQIDPDHNVYGARFRATDGSLLDAAPMPLGVGSGDQENVAVASDGSGFLVTYETVGDGIRGVRVSGAGATLDANPISIATDSLAHSSPASLIFDGTNYFAVWSDHRNGIQEDVFGTRIRPSDGAVLDPGG